MNPLNTLTNVLSTAATVPARLATLATAAVDTAVQVAQSVLGAAARVEERVEAKAESAAAETSAEAEERAVDLREEAAAQPSPLEGLTPNEAVLAVIEALDDSVSAAAISTALAEHGRTEDAATIDSALTMLATQKKITKHGPALYAPAQ